MNNHMYKPYIPEGINLDESIRSLMEKLGFCPFLKGYEYMVRAIELIYSEPNLIHSVVKDVYGKIAMENNVNPSCVERNCRTLLRARWNIRGDRGINFALLPRLHNGKSVPAVKEFIYMACNLLSAQISEECKQKTTGDVAN